MQVQIHKSCWSPDDMYFPQGPQLFEDHSEIYRGYPQQPEKLERFKGISPVCATVSKITKTKGTLCRVLCSACGEMHNLGQENPSNSSQLHAVAKKQD